MSHRNVVLIGMPGSGKSTIGVLLAKNLSCQFLDSDLVIQEKIGSRLQDYIDKYGSAAFDEMEDQVNAGIDVENTVIATGGSAVYGENAMRHFKEIGTVVYLRVSFEDLLERIPNFESRGISIPEGMTFQDLYNERIPLYERYADITVDAGKKEIWSAVEDITEALGD
ncbi:MAG: shikimate kinase [Acutalibacteraceae bacterium]|nr:shikimate kinase [Acutalibacteraceae bacterium]